MKDFIFIIALIGMGVSTVDGSPAWVVVIPSLLTLIGFAYADRRKKNSY